MYSLLNKRIEREKLYHLERLIIWSINNVGDIMQPKWEPPAITYATTIRLASSHFFLMNRKYWKKKDCNVFTKLSDSIFLKPTHTNNHHSHNLSRLANFQFFSHCSCFHFLCNQTETWTQPIIQNILQGKILTESQEKKKKNCLSPRSKYRKWRQREEE